MARNKWPTVLHQLQFFIEYKRSNDVVALISMNILNAQGLDGLVHVFTRFKVFYIGSGTSHQFYMDLIAK